MLDQLVESKSNSTENRRKGQFLAVIGGLAIFTLLTAWTVSLFGKDFGMGGDDLALTTLVAPVPVPEEEPPPPEPEKPKRAPKEASEEPAESIEEPSAPEPDQRAELRREALLAAIQKVENPRRPVTNDPAFWRCLAGMITRLFCGVKIEAFRRRPLGTTIETALDRLNHLSPSQLAGLIAEVLAEVGEAGHPDDAPLDALLAYTKINIKGATS